MFALADCNNFYASCERVFRPDLNGKPVVVLSNNDGCVIARSNEAKVLGIPMGAPAFKYQKIFEQNNVSIFSSNYALYGDMSNRVMTILSSFSPETEVYSIDEAFLRFDGCDYISLNDYGLKIRNTVYKSTGIPVSIGFANTKSLAKVANKIAKKFPDKTNNVYVIDSEEKRVKALKWLKIEDVWGIGRKHTKRLNSCGVINAYQFTQLSDEWVRKHLSVVGLRLKHDLQGIPTIELEHVKTKKNIATTRSFEKNYYEFEQIKERVSSFAVSCAGKLRRQKSNCNAIIVFLNTNYHDKNQPQYNNSRLIKLPYPTNSDIELSKFATEALQYIFKKGYYYKKAGVIVIDITPENQTQIKLFENSNPKHKLLMQTIDNLNQSIGNKKVKLGSQDVERTWKMRQEKLSPRYTTCLKEVFTVKAE